MKMTRNLIKGEVFAIEKDMRQKRLPYSRTFSADLYTRRTVQAIARKLADKYPRRYVNYTVVPGQYVLRITADAWHLEDDKAVESEMLLI